MDPGNPKMRIAVRTADGPAILNVTARASKESACHEVRRLRSGSVAGRTCSGLCSAGTDRAGVGLLAGGLRTLRSPHPPTFFMPHDLRRDRLPC